MNVVRFSSRVGRLFPSDCVLSSFSLGIPLGELAEAMPFFYNVLDDAWLGSSLVATSDDSLVVTHPRSLSSVNLPPPRPAAIV